MALRCPFPAPALLLTGLLAGPAPTQTPDARWSDDLHVGGVSPYQVHALAEYQGQLVVCGLGSVRGTPLHQIGLYDGARWRDLGRRVTYQVNPDSADVVACTVFRGDLIAGGVFDSIDGVAAWNIARFDGTRWHSMGIATEPGTISTVTALAVFQNELYVAGQFISVAGLPVHSIARWDGVQWRTVGAGIVQGPGVGYVRTMTTGSDGTLWVGGDFDTAGGVPAANIARWDGTRWRAVGSGLSSRVTALHEFQGRMHAGGAFADQAGVDHIAAFDGTSWVAVGGGLGATQVWAMATYANKLYVGGDIQRAGSVPVSQIATFDGTRWADLGGVGGNNGYVAPAVDAMLVHKGRLVIGGIFQRVGGETNRSGGLATSNLATHDGTAWGVVSPGAGADHEAWSLLPYRGQFVALGNMAHLGTAALARATLFDGYRHSRLAEFDGPTTAAIEFQNQLVVAGDFRTVNGQPTATVARWNGTQWSAMGTYDLTYGAPIGFVVFQNQLYALGGRLQRWTGSAWQYVGLSIVGSHCAAEFQGRLYIGGLLGPFQTDGLFEWDGTTMRVVPGGPNQEVLALLPYGTGLLVGGRFDHVGSQTIARLAQFNGQTFSAFGTPIPGPTSVWTLAQIEGLVYVGGDFDTARGAAANFVMRWNGAAWERLGSGTNSVVKQLLHDPASDSLWCLGMFFTAGGKPSASLARWRLHDVWQDLGHPLPGALATAELTGWGSLAGPAVDLQLRALPPDAFGFHVLGTSRIDAPVLGGILVPSPTVLIPFTGDPHGRTVLRLPIPAGIPPGAAVYTQSWFVDQGLTVAATNALQVQR